MHDIQVVPKCAYVERRHPACERSLSVFAVGIRCRYSLSVVDGDGEDRDGRADHGVGAFAGDRVA